MAKKEDRLHFWFDGRIIKRKEAKVPILTHSMQYGSGIFEGIRAYKTQNGTAIFRLNEHIKRFTKSSKIYGIDHGYAQSDIHEAIIKLVKINRLESCYIRPFAFYNDDHPSLKTAGRKISLFIATIPFGAYFGRGRENGIKCKISSWHRITSLILPTEGKGSGNYINSILASKEAEAAGADEAILTSINGDVAEGPGENIFVVEDGKLITPSIEADILLGITRDSVIKIAKHNGLEVVERNMHREELYTCDEAFFTGTAAEITPIVMVDGKSVGNGKPGIVTKLLAEDYSRITTGNNKEFEHWLTYVKW